MHCAVPIIGQDMGSTTWKKTADERVDTEAMMIVGRAYMDGELVPRDEVLALDWFVRAPMKGIRLHSHILHIIAMEAVF